MYSIKNLFQKSKESSYNFEKIDTDLIRKNPKILKIIRLSLNMSIHEFSKIFQMHQESRYERGLTIPTKRTLENFLRKLKNYRKECRFDLDFVSETNTKFLEKRKAGVLIGKKTLFKRNDQRTQKLSNLGARKGGLKTIRKYGKNHMAYLAKKIQKGRDKNSGFRSKAEMLTAKALDELRISYEYEIPLNGYLPDFVIKNKVLVEVMCTTTKQYWKKQKIKLSKLSDYNFVIITNRPKNLRETKRIKIIKFSKSVDVLKNRIKEKI